MLNRWGRWRSWWKRARSFGVVWSFSIWDLLCAQSASHHCCANGVVPLVPRFRGGHCSYLQVIKQFKPAITLANRLPMQINSMGHNGNEHLENTYSICKSTQWAIMEINILKILIQSATPELNSQQDFSICNNSTTRFTTRFTTFKTKKIKKKSKILLKDCVHVCVYRAGDSISTLQSSGTWV